MNHASHRTAAAALTCLLLVACGGGGDQAASPETDMAAAAAKSAAGAAVGAVTGLGVSTADLPPFVEVMPGAKAIQSLKTDMDGAVGGNVMLTTKAKPADIVAFYKASLERHGLKINLENASEQMVQIIAESEDKTRSLAIMIIVGEEGDPAINLTHRRPKA